MSKIARPAKGVPQALNPRITVSDIRKRWGKFDEAELAAIMGNGDLVAQIQAKYGLDKEQRAPLPPPASAWERAWASPPRAALGRVRA